MTDDDRTGVVYAEKLHTRRPGPRPGKTSCGLKLHRVQVVRERPVRDVPSDQRCRKCFPGSSRG